VACPQLRTASRRWLPGSRAAAWRQRKGPALAAGDREETVDQTTANHPQPQVWSIYGAKRAQPGATHGNGSGRMVIRPESATQVIEREKIRKDPRLAKCARTPRFRRTRTWHGGSRGTWVFLTRGDLQLRKTGGQASRFCAPIGLSPASRSRPTSELVTGRGRLDQSPDQPAAAKRERWEHVRAAIAPHPGIRRGFVVRLLLRKTPNPIRHPNLPR
jgi:hypothetical protein